jgi:GNAT superfamily N-acetyltransferase
MPNNRPLPDAVEMTFRAAAVEDLANCYRIFADGMREYVERLYGWDEADQRRKFVSVFRPQETRIICGRIGPAVAEVGWIQVETEHDAIHVKELHIVRASRNLGLGAWALARIVEEAVAARKDVRLATFEISPAVRFYRRLGFETAGGAGDVVWLRRRWEGSMGRP